MGCQFSAPVVIEPVPIQDILVSELPLVNEMHLGKGPDCRLEPYQKAYLDCHEIEIVTQEIFKRRDQVYINLELKNNEKSFKMQAETSFHLHIIKTEGRTYEDYNRLIFFRSEILVAKNIPHLPGIQEMELVLVDGYRRPQIKTMTIATPQFLEISYGKNILTLV
jgi:hypothetical protein